MNPVVVMAVWGRLPLVELNLRMLSAQGAQIIAITSLQHDYDYIKGLRIPGVQIISVPNNPLGKKWQSGVDHARLLGANPLIIVGSDDFLSQTFIKKACDLVKFNDFVFFDQWWIYAPETKKSYFLRYNMFKFDKPPLGSGRIYSTSLLGRASWRIFDTEIDWHLDNFSWENKHYDDRLCHNPNGMNILSIKGYWDSMNPLDRILSSDTIDWNQEHEIDRHFLFDSPIEKIFKNL